jgi:hypothetical protein
MPKAKIAIERISMLESFRTFLISGTASTGETSRRAANANLIA